jgi:hypothetical protein
MIKLNALLVVFSIVSFNAFGVMIGLCPATPPFGVIPCDTGCTGASAANMASQVSAAEFQMVSEFNKLNTSWVDAANADSELLLTYMQSKLQNSTQRITGYSSVEALVSMAASKNARDSQFLMDNLAIALELVSNNKKIDKMYKYAGSHQGSGDAETRIPSMLSKSILMSDPINNKYAHTEMLNDWNDIIQEYSKKEADILVLDADDASLTDVVLGQNKLSLAVSSEISKLLAFRHLYESDSESPSIKKRNIKDRLAIDLLLKTFDVDPLIDDKLTPVEIATDWFVSIENQKNISTNKPRDILIDLAVGQGIENALLNDYLTLKKGKNLVRAFN